MCHPPGGEWQHVAPPGLSEPRHCNLYHRMVEALKVWPPWALTIIRMHSRGVVNSMLNITQISPIWRTSLAYLDSRTLGCSQRNRLKFFSGSSVYINDFSLGVNNDSSNIYARRKCPSRSVYTGNTPGYRHMNQIICTASILPQPCRKFPPIYAPTGTL